MSKLSLALLGKGRNALSSSRVPLLGPVWRTPFRSLSTDGNGDGEPSPDSSSSSTVDPFLQPPEGGLVFAKLTGTARNVMKSDVIHFFEGCNLSPADIKVEYNRNYNPLSMMIQFPSQSSFDTALRTIRKGRLYNLNKVDRSQWEYTKSYDGKMILLQGIPRSAMMEDIERFLSGCNYDSSDLQVYPRNPGGNEPRYALVKCPSHIDAVNACLVKNRSFCQNSSLTVRVLQ